LLAAVVEDVSPLERVGLAGSESLVGQYADERGVLPVELRADCLDGLGCARIDRLGTAVGEAARADDRVPVETTPLDGAVEDALEQPERAIHGRNAGALLA